MTTEIVTVELRKQSAEAQASLTGRYQVDVVCDNCGHLQVAWIPQKVSVLGALANCVCLRCSVPALSRNVSRKSEAAI